MCLWDFYYDILLKPRPITINLCHYNVFLIWPIINSKDFFLLTKKVERTKVRKGLDTYHCCVLPHNLNLMWCGIESQENKWVNDQSMFHYWLKFGKEYNISTFPVNLTYKIIEFFEDYSSYFFFFTWDSYNSSSWFLKGEFQSPAIHCLVR